MPAMRVTLSEGQERPPVGEALPIAQGEALSPEEVERVLARLPALPAQEEDTQLFRLPEKSLPPPRPGVTVVQPFPPEEAAPAPEPPAAGPLKVLRYSPEGAVPLAPYVSVTFDQPMVPLTAIGDLAAQDVPVRLVPQPAGAWRWVGTKTLLFEPAGERLPMATEYTVEIPAGTQSVTGGTLAETVRWTFSTPPPKIVTHYPFGDPQVRKPLIVIVFDQRIDPHAVLKTITLKVGDTSYPLELAGQEDLQADEELRRLLASAGEGRWLAFYPTQLLPYDSLVEVIVGPGTPSAEGPRTTAAAQGFSFITYGPLRVVEARCGWGEDCRPTAPWWVRFSNPLDEEAFDPSQVRISPEVPGAEIWASGNTIGIRGRTQGRTTYQVTLSAQIKDRFGQTLTKDEVVTIKVGAAEPALLVPGDHLIVLDPYAPPTYSVYSRNYASLQVRAYAVTPEDWPAYLTYLRNAWEKEPPNPPGRQVMNRRISVEAKPDQLAETVIDLKGLLTNGRGHLVLVVEPGESLVASLLRDERKPTIRVWIAVTQLAVDVLQDDQELIAWVNALKDGAPLADVALTLFPGGVKATTGADGTARLPLPETEDEDTEAYLIARKGDDAALLPQATYVVYGGWRRPTTPYELRWYVWDDRQMYRPGEEVHVKGWLRQARIERGRDTLLLPAQGETVFYELYDAQGNRLANGGAALNALGGFDLVLSLPKTMNLGYARLRLTYRGQEYTHSFQVQEFRRPEFEVSTSADPGPYFVGDKATVHVAANYYAGGPLPDAEVTWRVTTTPGTFTPPNWDDFVFGIWLPWWWGDARRSSEQETQVSTFQGRTDASGAHHLRIALEGLDPPQAANLIAEATVMDVNRQAWAAATRLLVHPAELYVGLRSGRTFVQRGQPLVIEAIVTDLDGNAVPGRTIEMRAVRLRWAPVKGRWQQVEADEQTCTVVSAKEPVRCTFNTPEGGTYRIVATIQDDRGRRNLTQITCWVSGEERPAIQRVEQEEAELIPDKRIYQPGDVAEILVQSPFSPAEGLLTVQRDGLVSSQRFRLEEGSSILRVPIVADYIPNVHVQVDLVGAAQRLNSQGEPDARLPQRPAYATGRLNLQVSTYSRTLQVVATPRDKELEPGGETVVNVQVKEAAGAPVAGAELAVVVVDEAILALTGYQLADPIAAFYPQRPEGVGEYHLRGYVRLTDPTKLLEQAIPEAGGVERMALPAAVPTMIAEKALEADRMRAAEGPQGQAIRVRTDFNPLAVFAPAVPTDADGTASVRVKVPDNLTRYRIMVVAVAGTERYGKGESALTARLPLMVRPSPPRFLNFGDQCELPVVLQNQTDADLTVEVVMRGSNIVLTAGAGRRVTVPARNRVEVRFPVRTLSAGTARFQVGAVFGVWADAAQFELPVYTPATTEAFAVYGTVDEGVLAQPVIAPTNVYTQFGGLEISTSSTALQALTDAVLYLTAYKFECSEQLASRILAIAALHDVLSAFNAPGLPPEKDLVAAVERDIAKLQGMQNGDGGFPIWQKGRESWPFHTIHVAHALARARQKGFAVPDEMLTAALNYLRRIESHYPQSYGPDVRNTLTAYSLYVRSLLDDGDLDRARRLVREVGVENLHMDALGWLLAVLAPSSTPEGPRIQRFLANRVVETAGMANFTTGYREEDGYLLLASNRRTDGIILDALMAVDPQSDLIPKLVRGLLAHRTAGRWGNTQENVFILLALDRYFNTYEAQTPEFVARVWLGEQYVAEYQFVGRTTEYRTTVIPMHYLAQKAGAQSLILAKEGPGRLYYRLGLSYAPTSLQLDPMDQGFVVTRSYEAVDRPEDVRRDAEGVWHIAAGARVRVRLTMVVPTRRYHVALVDPLPAGLEALNPALAVTGSVPEDPNAPDVAPYWWWRWTWYQHQNLRDERAEAFASLVWEGVHTYTYVARATTPGRFVAPPVRAEEMYAPETFGRSGTDVVVVE